MSAAGARPVANFDHLIALSDDIAVFEHADHALPRPEHGYCVDDVARALVVVCSQPEPGPRLTELSRIYLDFVLAAVDTDGRCHNRMGTDREWADRPGLGDWWGRAIWGLGFAAAHAGTAGMRARALTGFRIAAQRRSRHPRATAFAVLGAAEVLAARPDEAAALALLRDAQATIDPPAADFGWAWPEPRLGYANGALVEALLLIGSLLPETTALARGVELLMFLTATEVRDGHVSVTPVGGRGIDDVGPAFDQQPIEVAALAGACAVAYRLLDADQWRGVVELSWAWFTGDNDATAPMFDPVSGGGYDGLHEHGPNLNQGAESTLAMLATAQHARRVAGHDR